MIPGLHDLAGNRTGRFLAFVAGALLVTAFAPFGFWWLAVFPPAVLLLIWEYATPRQAAWTGFTFGFGLFVAGTWWLYISLNILGGLWPPLAILLMLGLVVGNAAYIALTGYLTVRLMPAGLVRWLLVFPACWTLAEWLRGWVLSGFPWMSLGYTQAESVVGSVAPVFGVYGVSWVLVLFAGLIAALAGMRRERLTVPLVITGVLVATLWELDGRVWTEAAEEPLRVRLVQGAIPQDLKWKPEQLKPTLNLYRKLSNSDTPPDLIVWPEAAVPALPFEVRDFLQILHEDMVAQDSQLFLGILTYKPEEGEFFNTLWAVGEEEGRYYKRHLVPFGEYFPVPGFVREILRLMNLPSEDISPGEHGQQPLYVKGVPVAPTICYEIAYGAEQLEFFPLAQLMVNVSNDAWFGDTIAPYQHLQINQFRAREAGRYMLRATNTGVTAVIGPDGSIKSRIPQFEPGYVDAEVYPQTGQPPYLSFGNWPVVIFSSLLIGVAGLSSRRLYS
ncbi:MAG: apolipoprotein N-acyltransferase [Gammaproteobacteria bacterium]